MRYLFPWLFGGDLRAYGGRGLVVGREPCALCCAACDDCLRAWCFEDSRCDAARRVS